MARRTIQARRASPYLLYLVIAFAVLMVVCAVGWGWMYSLRNQAELNTFGQTALEQAAMNKTDIWADTFAEIGGTNPEMKGKPIVDVLRAVQDTATKYEAEVRRLTKEINGNPYEGLRGDELRRSASGVIKATTELLDQAGTTLQKSYQPGAEGAGEVHLAATNDAIAALIKRVDALVAQVNQDATSTANLETQIKGLQTELEAAKAEYARQIAQLNAQLQDEKARLTAARDNAIAESNKAKDDLQKMTDELIKRTRQFNVERDKTKREILVMQNNLKEQGDQLKIFREVPSETAVDGHVVSVSEEGNIAYADLGKKDGVLLGMTFSIFSPTELGKSEPKPKAQCRIVKIMNDSCQLRVYPLQSENPVVVGDLLHNPIYDRQRHLRFCLVGKMDIDGDGIDDTEQLKALIQDFGGRIDAAVSPQTDYLVIGEQPAVPSPPATTATDANAAMERQTYEEARKKFLEYTEAKANAENFRIPILSLNRFLGLVGLAGQR